MMIYGGEYMQPLKSALKPEQPRAVSILELAGGPSRQLREAVSPFPTITADYLLTDCFMIAWFRAWWRVIAREGGATVTAKLSVNGGPLAVYNVQFTGPAVIVDYGYRAVLSVSMSVVGDGTGYVVAGYVDEGYAE
jgi:hypothetical protein